jgi:hypothetical protein
LLTHKDIGGRIRGHDVGQRGGSGVDVADLNRVVVGVGDSGDLPDPQPIVVRLSRLEVARQHSAEQVRFGDERDDWHAQVGPEPDRR